jgi:hypothetical protein
MSSRDTPGWLRGYVRGEGGIGGQAEFAKVDLRKPAVILAAVAISAGVLGKIAVDRNAPRIKQWWDDQAVPAVQTVWRTIARQHEVVAHDATAEMPILSKTALEAFSSEIDVALEDSRSSMSVAEAQQYLLEILMAASIIADRMRALSNAHIEDDASLPELKITLEKLTTQQVTDTINRILATNTSILDDETSEIFARIFSGGHVVDGEYVPLTSEKIKEVLSLNPRMKIPRRHPDLGIVIIADRAGCAIRSGRQVVLGWSSGSRGFRSAPWSTRVTVTRAERGTSSRSPQACGSI